MSALVVSATFLQWFEDLPEQTLRSFTLIGITLSVIGFLYLTTDFFNRRVLARVLQFATPMFLTAGFMAVCSSFLVLIPEGYGFVVIYTLLAGMIGVFHGVFVVPYHRDEHKDKKPASKTTRVLTFTGRLRRFHRGIITGLKSARSRISVRRAFLGGCIGFLCLFLYALFALTLVAILGNLGSGFTPLILFILSAILGALGAVAGGIWRGFLYRSVQDEKHAGAALKDRPHQHASSHWSLPKLVGNVYHWLTDAPERPTAEKDEGLERQIKALVSMASTHPERSHEQSSALEAAIQALLHTHVIGQEQPAAIPARPPFLFKRDVKTGVFLWLGTFFPLVLLLSYLGIQSRTEAIITLLLGLGPLVVATLAGGFASGIAKFTYWVANHGSTKVLAGTGALLTLFGFMVTLIEPAANFAHALPNTLTYYGHSGTITAIEWSPDGNRIASGSYDGAIQIWNPATGERSITYHQRSILYSLAWSPDGTKIVSAWSDGTVKIWEARPDRQQHSDHPILVYHQSSLPIWTVAWSPDGTRIATGSSDGTVHVWNASSGKDIFPPLVAHGNSQVSAVAWSPDGKYIASGGDGIRVYVWDASSGKTVNVYQVHQFGVQSLSWSPDGKYLASSEADPFREQGVIKVWTALTGVTVLTLNVVYTNVVRWSPNGKFLASGSGLDSSVRVWAAWTGKDVTVYTGHTKGVYELAWSPDSTQIASGGYDTTVQVWNVGA